MAFVTFHFLRELSPSAFKLYVYFLELVQSKHRCVFTLPMVKLGYEAGLQPDCLYPAFRHGKDARLRKALAELIEKGLIEKEGQRGRVSNTYTRLVLFEKCFVNE